MKAALICSFLDLGKFESNVTYLTNISVTFLYTHHLIFTLKTFYLKVKNVAFMFFMAQTRKLMVLLVLPRSKKQSDLILFHYFHSLFCGDYCVKYLLSRTFKKKLAEKDYEPVRPRFDKHTDGIRVADLSKLFKYSNSLRTMWGSFCFVFQFFLPCLADPDAGGLEQGPV